MNRDDLVPIVEAALKSSGGKATLVQVAKYIWEHHELALRSSGDMFYTWQYSMRWAATKLRLSGKMRSKDLSPRGVWELNK